jgi:UDP-glucose 4-epimerase
MDTVLVTGGLGFTGRHIVAALVASGRKVVSYNRDYSPSDDPKAVAVQGELFDVPRLTRVLQEYGVERIVHTAAMSHPTLSLDFPVATFAANVDGTLAVFEAARLAGARRVVNFSSETVYGRVDGPVDAETPVRPTTPYAVTKVATEWLGQVFQNRYGLEVVSMRIAQVYGPGNRMPEVLGDMLKGVMRTGRFALASGGDHGFNLIHAEDVARATLCALEARGPFPMRGYNVSRAEYWRLSDVAGLARRLLPSADITIGPGLVPELDLQGPFCGEAAKRELGYVPVWSLERGLQDYATWLQGHDA